MDRELDSFVAELLSYPDGTPLSIEHEIVLDTILDDFLACEDFFQKLAEGSPEKARRLQSALWSGAAAELESAICRVEEAREATAMNGLSDEELEARLTLLALLPSEAPETERTARVLARTLAARNLLRVLEISQTQWGGDTEFWDRLRYELSWYFAAKGS